MIGPLAVDPVRYRAMMKELSFLHITDEAEVQNQGESDMIFTERQMRPVALWDRQYVSVELISGDTGTVEPKAVIWQYFNLEKKRFPIKCIIGRATMKSEPDFDSKTDVYNVIIGKYRRMLYCEKVKSENQFDMRWYVRRKM